MRKFVFTVPAKFQFSVHADSTSDARKKAATALEETFEPIVGGVIRTTPVDVTGGASEGELFLPDSVVPELIGLGPEEPDSPGF